MAEEQPCLEGEDEYLENLDHENDCGTQLDGDDILYARESYNYTQIDDNHVERLFYKDAKFTRIVGSSVTSQTSSVFPYCFVSYSL